MQEGASEFRREEEKLLLTHNVSAIRFKRCQFASGRLGSAVLVGED